MFIPYSYSYDMAHIEMLKQYAASIPEFVDAASAHSWLDPDYYPFYRAWFNRPYESSILNAIYGFFRAEPFGQKEILKAIAQFNERPFRRMQKDKSIMYDQCNVKSGDRVIVFGDLHGAFHSFVRALDRFKQEGLIDDALRITNKRAFFVLLGDYMNRSPYGFPLLAILLHFASVNPDNVILLRGNQERNRYWEDFLASRDFLKIMSGQEGLDVLPLAIEINNVFERLPDALILHHEGSGEDVICAHSVVPGSYKAQPSTQAFLRGESRSGKWLKRGLFFQDFFEGSAGWSLFSAPVALYKKYGGLDQDAWCELVVGERLSHGVLSSFHAECTPIEQPLSVPIENRWSLAYGHEILTKEDEDLLRKSKPYFLCASGDLSTFLRSVTEGTKQGEEVCFLNANQEGGVHGYFFRVVFLDDRYIPLNTLENVALFRERYGVDSLLLPQGTAPVQELMSQIKTGKFFVFFPYTGGATFRKSELRSMVHARQSYFDELERLLVYFQRRHNSRKIALVYQNDVFGAPLAQHAKEYLLQKYPLVSVEFVPFARGQLSMELQIEQLKKYNPESIGFFITNPAQISTIINDLGINTFVGKRIFAIAFEEYFAEVAGRWGVEAMFSSSFQPPRFRQGRLMELFRLLMEKYHYPLGITSYEAFFCSNIFLKAMRNVEPPVTSEKILQGIEALSGTDFFGMTLHFDPEVRGFILPIWIFEEDGSVVRLDPHYQDEN